MESRGLRVTCSCDEPELIHVNETARDAACSAHLRHCDSVHGTSNRECAAEDDSLAMFTVPDAWLGVP